MVGLEPLRPVIMQLIAFVLIMAGSVLVESAVMRRNVWTVIPRIVAEPENAATIWRESRGEWGSTGRKPEKGDPDANPPGERVGENGRLPDSALAAIPFAPTKRLHPNAATALAQLNEEYRARFGTNISITDAYRTYAQQERLYREKPHLAAKPGTSNHGWGLAVDLGGGINRFGTQQHNWMLANAGRYGWIHPAWAKQGQGKEEPWHWEYVGGSA